jgi:hypothetical protein
MERWLWNVHAVRLWELQQPDRRWPGENRREEHRERPDVPDWWRPSKEFAIRNPRPDDRVVRAAYPVTTLPTGSIGEFMGQGREIGYSGLTQAFLDALRTRLRAGDGPPTIGALMTEELNTLAEDARRNAKKRPWGWWVVWAVAFLIVFWHIGWAYTISHLTPTIGIGCRSGSYLVYGVLSSVTWLFQAFDPFPKKVVIYHVFNCFATVCLVFIVFVQVR